MPRSNYIPLSESTERVVSSEVSGPITSDVPVPTPLFVLSTVQSSVMDHDAKPWVARIRGPSEKWGLDREFIRGLRDYEHADTNMRGVPRGIVTRFPLRIGWLVECYHRASGRQRDGWTRYFGLVRPGGIEVWTADAVAAWAATQVRRVER